MCPLFNEVLWGHRDTLTSGNSEKVQRERGGGGGSGLKIPPCVACNDSLRQEGGESVHELLA